MGARCQPRSQAYRSVSAGIKDASFLLNTHRRGGERQDRFLRAFGLRPIMSGAQLEEIYVKDSSTAPLRSAAEQVRAGEEPERPPPKRHMCP